MPAARSLSFVALADVDAIKTSVATAVTEQTYATTALTGVLGENVIGTALFDSYPYGRRLTATSSASVGSYDLSDPISAVVLKVVKAGGTWSTEQVTLTAALTDVDGGETVSFDDVPIVRVVSITVPAQVDANGALEFGVSDLYARPGESVRAIVGLGTGNIKVRYDGPHDDTLPVLADRALSVAPNKIYGDAGTTTGLIVLL